MNTDNALKNTHNHKVSNVLNAGKNLAQSQASGTTRPKLFSRLVFIHYRTRGQYTTCLPQHSGIKHETKNQ